MKSTARIFIVMSAILASMLYLKPATAGELDQQSTQTFGDFTVHYMAFNSMFVQPNIAAIYDLTRAKNQAFLNITVQDKNGNAIEAKLDGHIKNLMQQKKTLSFKPIKEQAAMYYMAELRHTHEDVVHFAIDITPPGAKTFTLKFTRKLYVEP